MFQSTNRCNLRSRSQRRFLISRQFCASEWCLCLLWPTLTYLSWEVISSPRWMPLKHTAAWPKMHTYPAKWIAVWTYLSIWSSRYWWTALWWIFSKPTRPPASHLWKKFAKGNFPRTSGAKWSRHFRRKTQSKALSDATVLLGDPRLVPRDSLYTEKPLLKNIITS